MESTLARGTDEGGGRPRTLWKRPAVITALVLVIPLLGNHFVDGWNWPPGAFVLLGTFVSGLGLTYELLTRNSGTIAYRSAVGVALVTALPIVWGNFVQAADDVNPAALMYLWVPIVAIVGAALARFRPHGMALALFATALAQALVLTIALTRNPPMASWTAAVWRGFGGNAFCLMLFVGSALLFRRAAREESAPSEA